MRPSRKIARKIARKFGCLALVVAALLAGCSMRTQSEPETIDRGDVPFDLTAEDGPEGSGATPAGTEAVIYLVGPNGLVATPRPATAPVTAAETLRLLVDGPTDLETASGLRTEVPEGTSVLDVEQQGSLAIVDLGGGVEDVRARDGVTAFAQLVYTITELPQFDRVVFRLDGRRIEAPTGDGGLSSRPVSRDDYPPG